MLLATNTHIDRYDVLGLLGAGGMGEVYRAYDSRLEREVAIKVLASGMADAERLRRFEQEARATGALNHPNILAIYDVGSHQGAPYIVSELLEGTTLRQRLREEPIPVRKAIDYGQQVARGLAAAHAKGIVHRDLKPENLFLTRDGRVKILDFGLAKLRPVKSSLEDQTSAPTAALGSTEPGAILGTVGYMSPQQVRGQEIDHRSDLFSFGAILYEMLARGRAFQGDSPVEIMSAILNHEPAPLPTDVPPALERIVQHCLEKRPEDRFQSAQDLAFALEALSGSGISEPALKVAAAPKRVWRRIAMATVVVAALAVGLFAGRVAWKPVSPSFHKTTFRRGTIRNARFAPDGRTIVYGAAWDGAPFEIFSTRPESPESRALGIANADILAISSQGEMALSVGNKERAGFMAGLGTLARAPLAGGAPREVLERVRCADWSPNGAELAVVRRVNGKWRLEYPTGNLLYETPRPLWHVRVSPRGDRVAFIEFTRTGDTGFIAVIDRAGNRKVVTREWESIQGLAWRGDEIWYSASETGANLAVCAVSRGGRERTVLRAPGRLQLQDVSPDGRVLAVLDHLRSSVICQPPGETRERDLSWLDFSGFRDLTPDGRLLLTGESGEGGGLKSATYLRKTDGSAAVRIMDGNGQNISPDGKWVTAIVRKGSSSQVGLFPTSAGEPRFLSTGGVDAQWAGFSPTGDRVIVWGNEAGHALRYWLLGLEGGEPRAITAEGDFAYAPSPDGRFLLAGPEPRKLRLYPLEGGEPRPFPDPQGTPIQWAADARSLYVVRYEGLTARISITDVTTGRSVPWKTIALADPAGTAGPSQVVVTPDGKAYAYTVQRVLSDLYLIDGLK